jgi:hypothetical protein
MGAYSTDIMKRIIFEDELKNVLLLAPKISENLIPIKDYFEKRIQEIENEYGQDNRGPR